MQTIQMANDRTRGHNPAAMAAGGEFITFKLGQEKYGIEILNVQEIPGYEAVPRVQLTKGS